jgi:hypothetical protein
VSIIAARTVRKIVVNLSIERPLKYIWTWIPMHHRKIMTLTESVTSVLIVGAVSVVFPSRRFGKQKIE